MTIATRGATESRPLVTREGYSFELQAVSWRLNRFMVVSHRQVRELLSYDFYQGYIKTMAEFACGYSPRTVVALNYSFLKLLLFAGSSAIDSNLLIKYRKSGVATDYVLSYLRVFYSKWFELDYFGANREVVELLKSWTLRAGIKGDAVKRLDPLEGPLTDIELQGLMEGVAFGYELGKLDLTHTSLVMLLQVTGRRPLQLVDLRLKDLIEVNGDGGMPRFFVSIPRIKQRAGGFRLAFRRVEITEELWHVLQAQREYVIWRFSEHLGCEVSDELTKELPLYFSESRLIKVKCPSELLKYTGYDHLHADPNEVNRMLRFVVDKCDLISERTGDALHITPRRLRYTLATRAARAGFGVGVIAELLDHSNTANAVVYTLNVPEHAAYIDDIIKEHLSPYAKTFAGTIVESKLFALRGGEAGSDIRDLAGKGSGTCGHSGICGAAVPIPCYTCPHFQAWLDGPHEDLYTELLKDRAEILSVTGDYAVAAAQDRTILAVAQVVNACKSRREQVK
ncbi:Phage integrase [Pseudomonas savastanoi pv. glycinea]|nr:Phage integrase [Pseudomonas savastanoi pv. glycinea]